jgi:hypothetical protein
LFFVATHAGGDSVERGVQGCDVGCETCEGARFGRAAAVFVNERAQGGVAVEGRPADLGEGCDGGEGDGLAVFR